MDKLTRLIALSLLLGSSALHAEYFQITGENGGSFGFETLPESEVDCDKKKEIACYEGASNVYITNAEGQSFSFTVNDSEFVAEDKKIKYEFDVSSDGDDSLFTGDVSVSFDISKKKGDKYDAKLEIEIDGYHEEYGQIDFDETFNQKGADFVMLPNPPAEVPIPISALLFSSALIGVALIKRKSVAKV